MHRSWIFRLLPLLAAAALLAALLPAAPVFAAYENTHTNTGNQRLDIVKVAQTQIGYHEGPDNDNKYGAAFGQNGLGWCGLFVAWCARQADIPEAILPNTGLATGYNQYGTVHPKGDGYIPLPGDLALFYGESPSQATHVSIVESYNTATNQVTVIDGNWTDQVNHHSDPYSPGGKSEVSGYVVPHYSSGFTEITPFDIVAPQSLQLHEKFSLSGSFVSPRKITALKGEVLNASGETVLEHTLHPNQTAVSLTEFNGRLPFSAIDAGGAYTLKLTVTDTSETKIFEYPFTVAVSIFYCGEPDLGTLPNGDAYADLGVVAANGALGTFSVSVENEKGEKELESIVTTQDSQYSLNEAGLRLQHLGTGEYRLVISAPPGDDSSRCEVAFRVEREFDVPRGDLTLDGVVDIEDMLAMWLASSDQYLLTSAQKKSVGLESAPSAQEAYAYAAWISGTGDGTW